MKIKAARRPLASLALAVAAAAAMLFPSAGQGETPTAAPETEKPVIVFAATSMKTALDAVAAAWKTNSGKTASIAYASSGTLAKQIEQGAPADIFLSADLKWMDYLEKAKLIRAETRRKLLGNKLVLIESRDTDTKLEIARGFDLAAATGDGKIAVCALDLGTGGIYAKEALESLGVLARVEPKLAQADTIRNALALVSHGEAKFGIVFATDAKADPKVKVVGTFPASSHSPIVYPVALVAASVNPDAAFFLSYLTSQAATKIFTEQGFHMLPK
ncbi:MAG TPA: molybdate ABC transporter substrate-binding protein [Methylocella sp.]|nr:molybdate ABC transporter substrate-binding protein [Methylocella sp.]